MNENATQAGFFNASQAVHVMSKVNCDHEPVVRDGEFTSQQRDG